MLGTLDGKTALITGASRGIGRACLKILGKMGATVVGTATTLDGAHQISTFLEEQQLKGFGKVLNVCHKENIEEVLAQISQEVGAPLILINNAGITRDNLLVRMKDEEWNDIITTNLTSVFHLSRLALKAMMKSRWGRIINVSSIVGATGNPGQANYAAAKAGLMGFTKSIALEVGSRGITVNVVAPGFIDTDMTRKLSEDQRKTLLDKIPLNRLGEPEDIANMVAFLASDHASYITGETLHVNGGMFMI